MLDQLYEWFMARQPEIIDWNLRVMPTILAVALLISIALNIILFVPYLWDLFQWLHGLIRQEINDPGHGSPPLFNFSLFIPAVRVQRMGSDCTTCTAIGPINDAMCAWKDDYGLIPPKLAKRLTPGARS